MKKSERAWLYYRLSRDEDKKQNSLKNQSKIVKGYAAQNGYEIVGESCDDNVSGMHFQRDGIEELQDAVEKGLVDVVLVKDLSRIGRHRTQTALFIDYLRSCKVKLVSATENIDTFNENDELIIGVKQLLNDQYARDIARKIRTGFKQKQKDGIVIIPPFGYVKDKNTNEIRIVEECAEIVRLIFSLYLDGLGGRKIAQYLNEHGYKSPAYYQKLHYNKSVPFNRTKIGKQYIWSDIGVMNVIGNEAYIGTLLCGKTSKSTIYKTREYIPEEQQIRHEHFYPPIISEETWKLANIIRESHLVNKVRAGNQKIHRYAGFLRCADCGASFTTKKRKDNGCDYIEYVCTTYHKQGAKYCTSHRIREDSLDNLLYGEMAILQELAADNLRKIDEFITVWTKKNDDYDQMVGKFQMQLIELSENIKSLIMQQVKEPQRSGFINELIKDCERQMEKITQQIDGLKTSGEIGKNAKLNIKSSVEILDQVIRERSIDNAHLNLILEKVLISQSDDNMINLEFILKAPLKTHVDMHEFIANSVVSDKNKINIAKAS